eukprot:TRINITY_DN2818_c0_g1_i5.p3 TRINITY_DN2818_c0_g1~~TRINITY_DN2818_c0_g1_i5.p3  ORF type:complete len:129 (+),score=19.64 TRINITY_DN2818_c0_g1_i5:694-1080(+)
MINHTTYQVFNQNKKKYKQNTTEQSFKLLISQIFIKSHYARFFIFLTFKYLLSYCKQKRFFNQIFQNKQILIKLNTSKNNPYSQPKITFQTPHSKIVTCLLYTSDAADDMQCVDLGGRRIIKKKKKKQ